jgi:DNA invertase Pin-like site-specific DNA recombinase
MNAVIYARYSSENQREESIEGQLRECKEFAEKQSIIVIDTYIDRALSARTDDRPQFQQMIRDSGKKLFDLVIVWKLDRFSRDRYDSAHYKRLLGKNGAKVVSATEPITNGASGILLESMLEGMAEYYSAELSEKVNRGMTENVLKGISNGRALPLGLRLDGDRHFQIDEDTAPLVRAMFTMADNGKPLKEISEYLKERGVRSARGNPISTNTMTKLLHNRKYIGEYSHGTTVNPDAIPPIISKELFERVQARFEANRLAPAKREVGDGEHYLLTTKLICGDCNMFMSGESGKSGTGKIHRYYKCSNAKRGMGCKRKPIRKEPIEDFIVGCAKELPADDALIERLTDMLEKVQGDGNVVIPVLKRELAEVEKKIENVLDAIDRGVVTSSTKARLESHEARRDELNANIAAEEIRRVYIPREQIRFWLLRFRDTDTSDYEQRRRLIDTFINSVYVFDDRIVINFNYRDRSRTVSMDEVKSSSLVDSGAPNHQYPNLFPVGETFGYVFYFDKL